jgi:hypothetical protein
MATMRAQPLAADAVRHVLAAGRGDLRGQRRDGHPEPVPVVRHQDRLDRLADPGVQRPAQHGRQPRVVLHAGGLVGVHGPRRALAEHLVQRALLHVHLAERGEHRGDVLQERRVGADHEDAVALEPAAVDVEEIRGAVQADGGLAGARSALHAQRVVELGADQLVLLGLDRGHDVAHRPHPGTFDLRGQQPAGGAELLAAVQSLVLEARQPDRMVGRPAEPAPRRHALRVVRAGPVEAGRHRCAPVDHERLAAAGVDDPAPADVVGLVAVLAGVRPVVEPQPPEVQRAVRLLGQLLGVALEHPAEPLGGVPVAGHLLAGRDPHPGVLQHPREGAPGAGQERLLVREVAVELVASGVPGGWRRWHGSLEGSGREGHRNSVKFVSENQN